MTRLVDRITKGPVKAVLDTTVYVCSPREFICTCHQSISDGLVSANAELIAEAFTVAHETGLSPAELVAQRDELEASCSQLADLMVSKSTELNVTKTQLGEAVAALRYISEHCDGRGQIAATEALAKLERAR